MQDRFGFEPSKDLEGKEFELRSPNVNAIHTMDISEMRVTDTS